MPLLSLRCPHRAKVADHQVGLHGLCALLGTVSTLQECYARAMYNGLQCFIITDASSMMHGLFPYL